MPIFLYVAVVSDNDGSAFITKAEFDSLKNNFQAQIDNYNQSIDSKIDGAIASYLAGIKVNTDDSPEYRVWGTSYGSLDGKTCNAFRVVEAGNGTLPCNGSFPASGCVTGYSTAVYGYHLVSTSLTNRGYGPGFWITGYHATGVGGSSIIADDSMGFIVSYLAAWGLYNSAVAGNNMGIHVETTDPATAATTWPDAGVGRYSIFGETIRDRLFCKNLSDIFQTCIGVVDPAFPLYEFLDNGTVQISLAYQENGGKWEDTLRPAGTATAVTYHMGRDRTQSQTQRGNTWSFNGLSRTPVIQLQLDHAGTKTCIIDVWDDSYNQRNPSGAWITKEFDVRAGDKVLLQLTCSPSGGNTGSYSIWFFTNKIPGWKNADEP